MRKPPKIVSVLILVSFLIHPLNLRAEDVLPQGGVVTAGSAQLDYSQAGVLNVNVGASSNIANWQSYSVGSTNTVNYNRDSSFTFLNRVVGSNPSQIFGSINALNGKIFLINQNGILFAPGSSVNAAGLTASTLDMRDADFLAGRYTFFGKGGSVVSQGYISTPGGFVALLGSTVENAGVIEANLGKVILASGERITLGLDPLDAISVVIDEATAQNLENKDNAVHNIGKIKADGGKVILTAKTLDGVFKAAANNEGVIEAKSLVSKKGEVYLLGNMENDTVANKGTIDVSAADAGVDGGFVELSAFNLDFVDGTIDNRSASGNTGKILFDPWDITIGNSEAHNLEDHTYGNVTIEALNDVNFSISDDLLNLKYYGDGEYFKILAGRNINFNDDSVTTQGADIILNADKDFWYQSGSYYPKQWVNTADGEGSINLGSGTLRSNGGDIELKAGKDINLGSGAIRSSGGKVTLLADASYPYDAQPTVDEGYNLWHPGYWEVIDGGRIWHDGYSHWWHWHPGYWEELPDTWLWHDGYNQWIAQLVNGAPGSTNTADGVGNINLGTGSGIITGGGAADLSAVNIYATEDILTSGGALNLTATKDIEVKGNLDAGSGQAEVLAGDDVLLKDHGRLAAGDLTVSSGDDTYMRDHASINVIDKLVMSVGDDFTMEDSAAIRSGSAYITTGDTYLNNDADIDVRGIFNITAEDMIMNDSSDIDANIVNILTGNDFLMYDSSDIGDDGDNFSTYINAGRDVRISDNSIYTDFATVVAGDDISLGKIFATNLISLNAGDDITDHNGSDINLTTDALFMVAGGTIGQDGASIETNVNDIWATANNGDVWLIEKDGVNLQDIQALGSTVNIVTGGDTNTYNIYAQGSGFMDPAIVNLTVDGDLNVLGDGIVASRSGEGWALIDLVADGDINVNSRVLTYTGSGRSVSKISMNSRFDDINIVGSPVQALVYGDGHAEVNLNADDDINVDYSDVRAIAGSGPDTALVKMHADEDINIRNDSDVEAILSEYGHAEIDLKAENDVNISASRIGAYSGSGEKTALVKIKADDDINIFNSRVTANMVNYGHAEVNLFAGDDIRLCGSTLLATSGYGTNTALLKLFAFDDISIGFSNLQAIMSGDGTAKVEMTAKYGDISIFGAYIKAQVYGNGHAETELSADGRLDIAYSNVKAKAGSGSAHVELFVDDHDININNSDIKARVYGYGTAKVEMDAKDDIRIHSSNIKAKSGSSDFTALVDMDAGDSISVNNSLVLAKVEGDGHAEVKLEAGSKRGWFNQGNITLINSDILAKTGSGLESALVVLNAAGNISLFFSSVKAVNNSFGRASVYFNAGEEINLFASKVAARTGFGDAVADLDANDINLTFSTVLAKAICGSAKVALDAKDDIKLFFSDLTAKVLGRGHAEVKLEAGSRWSWFNKGNITLIGSDILAKVGGGLESALVVLNANGNIKATFSTIEALNNSFGPASIYFNAGEDINLLKSSITARTDFGKAVVDLDAEDINLTFSRVLAKAVCGIAEVSLDAKDDIKLLFSDLTAKVLGRGHAEVKLEAGSRWSWFNKGNITLIGSEILAKVGSGLESALVVLNATGDINASFSTIEALNNSFGPASVYFNAGEDINLFLSSITARTDFGKAVVDLDAEDISLTFSRVLAKAIYGSAKVVLDAQDDIKLFFSDLTAKVLGRGHAEVKLEAGDDVTISQSRISAFSGSGDDTALVKINADENIKIVNSLVQAEMAGNGRAKIEMDAGRNLKIADSVVKALVNGEGRAKIKLEAGRNVKIKDSTVKAKVNDGSAKIKVKAGNDVKIKDSLLKAKVNGSGDAKIKVVAKDDIKLKNSKIRSVASMGSALTDLKARGDIAITGSKVKAKVKDNGHAQVVFRATDINLNQSTVAAESNSGLTSAYVTMYAKDSILADASQIFARMFNYGHAEVYLDAGYIGLHNGTELWAETGSFGSLPPTDISTALIQLYSSGNIDLDGASWISAISHDNTPAAVLAIADGDITVDADSGIYAGSADGLAGIGLISGGNIYGYGQISAESDNNLAGVGLLADGDLYALNVSARGNASPDLIGLAEILIGNYLIGGPVDIAAYFAYSSGIALGSLYGNIYLGNVSADIVLAAALGLGGKTGDDEAYLSVSESESEVTGGNIYMYNFENWVEDSEPADSELRLKESSGHFEYSNGEVKAHFLGLLARGNIGLPADSETGLGPIKTDIDILSAYSYDLGNIFVANKGYTEVEEEVFDTLGNSLGFQTVKKNKPLQIGMYLPVFALESEESDEVLRDSVGDSIETGIWRQIGAIGASVAANNGIVNITSAGDLIVNSIISPRGGVYLETTDGSIFAGRGWCPVISQGQLDDIFGGEESSIESFSSWSLKSLVEEALMDLSGTAWKDVAGMDYFTPVMFAAEGLTETSDLPFGPNVIAGGYSYFSAANGTIGVGAFGDDTVGLFDNPLKVNIQVLEENLAGNNSALPGGGTSAAGLTLKIGGGAGSFDGLNGPLPVSGFIEGLVRPGTTAITGVDPSPELDLADVQPAGYVYYNDTSSAYGEDCPECSVALYGPKPADRGILQIWPELPIQIDINQLAIDPRIRNIYNPNFRTVTFDRQTPTGTYFYHPLMLADSSAFDAILLDAGAYDFIDGNLDLKGDLSPFYDINGKKKKGKS